jgi:Skp family chaperone for outer membrane proteins
VEYQQKDDQLTSLQADLAAKARQADKAFATRQATMLRNLYGDVNAVIRSAARYYGLTLVMRVDPADPNNPTSRTQVMKELNRQVLYHDASMDITKAVLNTLNKRYEQDVVGGSKGGSSNTKSRTATSQKRTRKRR